MMVSGKVIFGATQHLPYPPQRPAKRPLPADKAAEWAWRDELPKAPRQTGPDGFFSAWNAVAGYGETLAPIDGDLNRYGLVPDFGAGDVPHADAVALYQAVSALDDWEIDLPEDWSVAPEIDGFGGLASRAIAAALRRARRPVSAIVANRAIMGLDPMTMTIGETTVEHERDASGRERWFVHRQVWTVTGHNADGSERTALETIEAPGLDKRRRPLPGAWRKPFLDPDPVDAVVARIEHEIWHAALTIVAGELAGKLETIDLAPPEASPRPWLAQPRITRILPDLTVRLAAKKL